MQIITMGREGLTLNDLIQVARNGAQVALTDAAEKRIARSWQLITRWVAEERSVYGVTTGFGALSDVAISQADTRQLQVNILKSHAVGVGQPLAAESVRAMMALRIKDFARGNAGVRNATVAALIQLINSGVVPVVPTEPFSGTTGTMPLLISCIKAATVALRTPALPRAKSLIRRAIMALTISAASG